MSYLTARKIRIVFRARWVQPPTDSDGLHTYFAIAAPVDTFEDEPAETGRSAEYPRTYNVLSGSTVDQNDTNNSVDPRFWPLFLYYRNTSTSPASSGSLTITGWVADRSDVSPSIDPGSTWYTATYQANFLSLPKPAAGEWHDYAIEIEYPERYVDPGVSSFNGYVNDTGFMTVRFWMDGVEKDINSFTIDSVTYTEPIIGASSINFSSEDTGTPRTENNYQLIVPQISRGLDFYSYNTTDVPMTFNNAIEYDSQGVSYIGNYIDGTSNVLEVIIGPYFSPSYIADDYVADGTLAAEANLTASGGGLVLASASLAADFQQATSGSTQKDITLTAFGDSVMTVSGDKVSLLEADLAADFQFDVSADLSSDLSHEFVADFQISVTATKTADAEAAVAGDFQIDVTATRIVDAQATLDTTFDSECMGGRIVEPNEPYPIYWQDIGEWDQWPFSVWEKRGLLMASVFEGYFNGGKIVEGAAGIESDTQLAANGGYLTEGSADLDTTFDFEPGIGKLTGGAGLVITDVDMTTDAVVTLSGQADLAADFQFDTTPIVAFNESVSMSTEFAVTATPKRTIGFTEDLATTVTVAVIGSYIHGGSANLVCDSSTLTVGTIFKVDEYRTLRVLPESRVWSMVRETRTNRVIPETRAWLVEGYEI